MLYCHACAASALHEHVHNNCIRHAAGHHGDAKADRVCTAKRNWTFWLVTGPNQSEARAATESDSNHGGWYNRGSVGAGWQLSIPRFVSRMVKMLEKYISNIFCNLFIGLLGKNVLLNYYYYVPYWHHCHYHSQHENIIVITNTITVIFIKTTSSAHQFGTPWLLFLRYLRRRSMENMCYLKQTIVTSVGDFKTWC